MKYLHKLAISKKKLLPTGMLLTSIFINNTSLYAKTQHSYSVYTPTFQKSLLLQDTQFLPKHYSTPQEYYSSLHAHDTVELIIGDGSMQGKPLPLNMDYLELKNTIHTTSVDLDSTISGLKAYKANIYGNIATTDSSGKLISIKQTTINGQNTSTQTLAIDFKNNNSNNTIMLNYSSLGYESTQTVAGVDSTGNTVTVTIPMGVGGGIEVGNGDNVIWIGGSVKDEFYWDGHGTGYDGPTRVYGNLKLGTGKNELKIYGRSTVYGDITLEGGHNSIEFDSATIGVIHYDTLPQPLVAQGNVSIKGEKNSIHFNRADIAGTVTIDKGQNTLNIESSTIYGKLKVGDTTSLGSSVEVNNDIKLTYANIYDGLEVMGDKNRIEIRGGMIGTWDNDKVTYKDIVIGGEDNTLSLHSLIFGGEIKGKGEIGLHAGAVWEGQVSGAGTPASDVKTVTIKDGQKVTLYAASQINGNVVFESDSQELSLYGGYIDGNIGDKTAKKGQLNILHTDNQDTFVSNPTSIVYGDIYVKTLSVGEKTTLILDKMENNSNDTSNSSQPVPPVHDTIERVIDADSIILSGDIVLAGRVLGNKLSVTGTIEHKGGSFALNVNFEEGKSDILDFTNATIKGTGGENKIVYFLPEAPLYYATLGTILEGVVLGDESLSVGLSHTDVGGYEYELIRNPNTGKNQWDLRLVRISASNYAYAGILENMRNYSRHLLSNLNTTFMQSRLAQHALSISLLPNSSMNKRIFKEFGITTWGNVNYITNTIYDPEAPTIEERTTIATAGISAEEISIGKDNKLTLSAFIGYGNTQSQLDQYFRKHTMTMNALSIGALGIWDYKGFGSKHTIFTTIGVWTDIVENRVNLEGLDRNTTWNAYAIKAVASLGYQLQEGSILFLTSLDTTYGFTRGTSFITFSKNAIDIADDHQIAMRINALVGYSLRFGLSPFLQFYTDIPIYTKTDGTIRSNGYSFNYKSENFTTGFNVGLNYTIAFGEDNLRAYILLGIHKGQPSSIVEVGFTAGGGLSYTF